MSIGLAQLWVTTSTATAAEGTVRVHGSGDPIAGAQVRAGEVATTTDELGRFALDVPDDAQLEVSAEGFLTGISPASDQPIVVRLVRSVEEVVVIGTAPRESVEHVVSVDELRRVPGTFGDPIRALQSLPSVSRTGDLSGELVVRGAEATNTAVYVDGMRVPYLYHLLLGRSVVDPALVEEVSFHPGAVPPRFGNVTQAVVDARIAKGPAKRGLHGTAHVDPLDGGASLSANLSPDTTLRTSGRLGWAAAAASAGLGVLNAATGSAGQRPELAFPYEDHALRLDHRSGAAVWSLSVIGAHDTLRFVPVGTSEEVEQRAIRDAGYDPFRLLDAGFFRARLRWERAEGERRAAAWVLGGRDVQQNLIPFLGALGAGGIQDARATQWNGTAGFSAATPLGHRVALELGGEGVVQPSAYEELGEIGPQREIELLTAYAGPYVALPIDLGRDQASSISPAVRVSSHLLGDEWVVVPEPQGSTRLRLSDRADLVGFVGMSSQGPKLAEIGAGDDRALGVTRAAQTSLGVELELGRGVSLDATGYATEMWGIVVRDTRLSILDRPSDPTRAGMPATTTGGDRIPTVWHGFLHEEPVFRSATGEAVGGEVLLRMMPRGPQFGWISASVGRSFRTTGGPDGERTPSDADLPLSLVGVYGVGFPARWSASLRGQVTSGLPFTPLEPVYAGVFNDPGYAEIAWFDYGGVPGDTNGDRYPAYVRFDLHLEKTWEGRRAEWTAYLDVFNATNQHNPLMASYNWNYTELERDIYVPVVPSLGLAVEY